MWGPWGVKESRAVQESSKKKQQQERSYPLYFLSSLPEQAAKPARREVGEFTAAGNDGKSNEIK